MVEQYQQPYQMPDLSGKIRDLEEKIRLLKDRTLLLGQSLVEEREKSFKEIQEIKKTMIKIVEDNRRLKELMERIAEQLNNSVRKDELIMLQKQLDLIRK
jgi:predicted  nucleic acid-binding Zn-ribbon protein